MSASYATTGSPEIWSLFFEEQDVESSWEWMFWENTTRIEIKHDEMYLLLIKL